MEISFWRKATQSAENLGRSPNGKGTAVVDSFWYLGDKSSVEGCADVITPRGFFLLVSRSLSYPGKELLTIGFDE